MTIKEAEKKRKNDIKGNGENKMIEKVTQARKKKNSSL